MAAEMLGSVISAMLLCGPWNVRPEDFLRWVYLCAAFSLVVPAYDYQVGNSAEDVFGQTNDSEES